MKKLLLFLFVLLMVPQNVDAKNIVKTNEVYTPKNVLEDLNRLKKKYPEILSIREIGKSHYEQPIMAVKLGRGEKSILINASHHGREWMTTMIVMKMMEEYAKAYEEGVTIKGYDTSILDEISIWFVPMVNPDGVTLQQQGLFSSLDMEPWELLLMNGGSIDFSRWKANGIGEDLNRQYSAGWKNISGSAPYPFYQLYKGKKPFTAPEAKVMKNFTQRINPIIALSYHSSGRVLYWYYETDSALLKRDHSIAKKIANVTGYKLSKPDKTAVGGGYTDWFIHTFKRPAITVEISYPVNETNPPLSVFPEEWRRNQVIGLLTAYEAKKLGK